MKKRGRLGYSRSSEQDPGEPAGHRPGCAQPGGLPVREPGPSSSITFIFLLPLTSLVSALTTPSPSDAEN